MWKVTQTFAIADDTMRHKAEQENRERRRGKERTRPVVHTKPNVFDRINKERVEPQISHNNLTPVTWTKVEILTFHRGILRSPLHCKLLFIKKIEVVGVISIKTMI